MCLPHRYISTEGILLSSNGGTHGPWYDIPDNLATQYVVELIFFCSSNFFTTAAAYTATTTTATTGATTAAANTAATIAATEATTTTTTALTTTTTTAAVHKATRNVHMSVHTTYCTYLSYPSWQCLPLFYSSGATVLYYLLIGSDAECENTANCECKIVSPITTCIIRLKSILNQIHPPPPPPPPPPTHTHVRCCGLLQPTQRGEERYLGSRQVTTCTYTQPKQQQAYP